MWRFFPSIWNVTAHALTDRRAVLKGIAFVKSSNPLQDRPRPPPKRSVRPTIPSCDANNRVVVGPRRAPVRHPSTYGFSSSPQCAGIAARIGEDLTFSCLGVVPRTEPHCGASMGVERLLSCSIAMASFLRSDDRRAATLTAGWIRCRHGDPSPLALHDIEAKRKKSYDPINFKA